MAKRDEHGKKQTPPFTPQPQPKPSDADIKKYKEIKEKRNKERRRKGEKDNKSETKEKAPVQGGAAGAESSLEAFFENLQYRHRRLRCLGSRRICRPACRSLRHADLPIAQQGA